MIVQLANKITLSTTHLGVEQRIALTLGYRRHCKVTFLVELLSGHGSTRHLTCAAFHPANSRFRS